MLNFSWTLVTPSVSLRAMFILVEFPFAKPQSTNSGKVESFIEIDVPEASSKKLAPEVSAPKAI